MKYLIIITYLMININGIFIRQEEPVHWYFTATKIDSLSYEIHFKAKIDKPWHIYSQQNDEDLVLPTKITITNNPAYELQGKMKEVGVLESQKVSGTAVNFYKDSVDFIQMVKLKTQIKTRVYGSVDYMACAERCLPPEKRRFVVTIGIN